MSAKGNALPIPEPAVADPKSCEMVRAWIADGALHCALNIGIWKDPGPWGILLADVVRHVANAHEESEGREKPTDEPKGGFVN